MKQKISILIMIFAVVLGISQTSYAQNGKNLTIDEAIKRLTELVIESFDEKQFLESIDKDEEELNAMKTAEDIEFDRQLAEERRKDDVARFNEILAKNKSLTKDQKDFIKENHNKVSDLVEQESLNRITARLLEEAKEAHKLLIDSFQRSLAKKFNAEELNKLVKFFKSDEGKKAMKFFPTMITASNPAMDKEGFLAGDEAKAAKAKYGEHYEIFVKTSLGKRFETALFTDGYNFSMKETFKRLEAEMDKLEKSSNAELIKEDTEKREKIEAEINKVFYKFVEENYDPQRNKDKKGKN